MPKIQIDFRLSDSDSEIFTPKKPYWKKLRLPEGVTPEQEEAIIQKREAEA
jgi:hypothetical protein